MHALHIARCCLALVGCMLGGARNMSCQILYLPTTNLPTMLTPVYQTSFAHRCLGKPAAHHDEICLHVLAAYSMLYMWHAGACCRQRVHWSWQHSQSCIQAPWVSHSPGILSGKASCACAPGPMVWARALQRAPTRCAAVQLLLADLRLVCIAHLGASSCGSLCC